MAKILVIDDNEDIRAVVAGILECAGHVVSSVPNAEQGCQLQREAPADLVITDIFMPGKDGLETIRDMKHEFPGLGFVAMTGAGGRPSSADHLVTAEHIGADATLRKPFEADALLAAVAEAMQRCAVR